MENLRMLEAFRKLEESLGEEATTELIKLFDDKLDEMKQELATKSDIARIETSMAKMEGTIIKWVIGLGSTFTLLYAGTQLLLPYLSK